MSDKEWLNGYERVNLNGALVDGAVYCVCCGRFGGTICSVVDDNQPEPNEVPIWPFSESDCPVCDVQFKELSVARLLEITAQELSVIGESKLRKALILAKLNNKH